MRIPHGTPITSCTYLGQRLLLCLGCLPSILGNFRPNVSGGSSSLPPHAGLAESLKSWGYKRVIYSLSFEYISLIYLQNIVAVNATPVPPARPGMYAAVFTRGVSKDQQISKAIFLETPLNKKRRNIWQNSVLASQGRILSNIAFVFWAMEFHEKLLLRITDLQARHFFS